MTRQAGLIVELRQLNLRRGGRRVLRDLDWRIEPGQRWVVVGGNGAGKTQLLKVVAGSVWPDPVAGGRVAPRRYRWQGRWHDDTLDVQAEIAYLGPERQDRYARYDWNFTVADVVGTGFDRADIPQRDLSPALRRRALCLLGDLGIEHLAAMRVLEISSGERRLALLARALATRPALLLLDETLTHLDATRQAQLLDWLEASTGSGLTWVLSTHRRDHLPRAASHALVLRQGRVLAAGRIKLPAVQRALARVLAAQGPGQRRAAAPPAARRRRTRALLEVRQGELWLERQLIASGIDLRLGAGECWVLSGANGSGKTTLLRALYGDFPFAAGSRVTRIGVRPGEPLQHFRLRCGFVAPQLQTDFPLQETVLHAVLSGWSASHGLGESPTPAARAAADRCLRFWRLRSWSQRRLSELSYGQVRRVLFARAWLRRPRVLLLDEPFAGLDSAQRRLLAQRLEQVRAQGVGIILASHHDDERPSHCDGEWRLADQRLVRLPDRCAVA